MKMIIHAYEMIFRTLVQRHRGAKETLVEILGIQFLNLMGLPPEAPAS